MVDQTTPNTTLNPQQTAQAILVQITEHPERLNQSNWESLDYRTRCVGGWAIFFHLGYVPRETSLGNVFDKAQRYLGLSYKDAHLLLFDCNNAEATEALKYLAAGKPIDWKVVLPNWLYCS